jgi:hypothetical protein
MKKRLNSRYFPLPEADAEGAIETSRYDPGRAAARAVRQFTPGGPPVLLPIIHRPIAGIP